MQMTSKEGAENIALWIGFSGWMDGPYDDNDDCDIVAWWMDLESNHASGSNMSPLDSFFLDLCLRTIQPAALLMPNSSISK